MARAATSIDYMLTGASHRGRQRLLYLQRARVVRAPHHRETVAVTEPVAQRQPLPPTAAAHVALARAWTHVDPAPTALRVLVHQHRTRPIGPCAPCAPQQRPPS